jgi:predicted deacylase
MIIVLRGMLLALLAVVHACASAEESAGAAWGPIDLKSVVVAPGTKQKGRFQERATFEGSFLDSALWAARGAAPGPTLCVVAAIHGDEINSFEIARRSFHRIDPALLKGTMIVVPEANAAGFRNRNRYIMDRRDLNRAFPGSRRGSDTSLVASILFERVIRNCNYLVDLHTGSNFRSNIAQIRVDMKNAQALALAENFGVGVIIGGAGPRGSLRRAAVEAGVPAIIYEAGPPYVFLEREIELGMQGVLNVMDYLGMYESGVPRARPKKLLSSSWVRVPPGQGGVFLTEVTLGDAVKEGQLLGTVADPVTDEVHEIRASRSGVVIGAALPQVVLSGYGVFHVGEIK